MVIYLRFSVHAKFKYNRVENYKMLNLLLNQATSIYVDQFMYKYLVKIS